MKRAYQADNSTEAHIVAMMLRAHGIEAHVGGHFLQGGVGEIGAFGFAEVLVENEDYGKARALIQDYEAGNLTRDGEA